MITVNQDISTTIHRVGSIAIGPMVLLTLIWEQLELYITTNEVFRDFQSLPSLKFTGNVAMDYGVVPR